MSYEKRFENAIAQCALCDSACCTQCVTEEESIESNEMESNRIESNRSSRAFGFDEIDPKEQHSNFDESVSEYSIIEYAPLGSRVRDDLPAAISSATPIGHRRPQTKTIRSPVVLFSSVHFLWVHSKTTRKTNSILQSSALH